MPRLSKEIASKVANTEYDPNKSTRDPLPVGEYVCRLRSVEARTASTGNPMWVTEWEVADPDNSEHNGRRLWANVVLTDAALWKVKEFFYAFGVSETTDTEDLIGESARLYVSQRIIRGGSREGQTGNNVDTFAPLDDDDEPAARKPAARKPAAKTVDPDEF